MRVLILMYCRQALSEIIPSLATRPFNKTRLCWYTDTPTGDFIITYHPSHPNLFLATGGSGHGYKFLPVIGDEVRLFLFSFSIQLFLFFSFPR